MHAGRCRAVFGLRRPGVGAYLTRRTVCDDCASAARRPCRLCRPELALYHIDRRQTTPIVRFSLDENSPHAGWVYNCQWTPDSRAVCFTWLHAEEPTDAEATPSENGDATPAETAQTSNSEHSLMLYEIASGRLTELPISVQAPRWSADGKYLMGLSDDEEPPSIHIYRTDTWVCTQQIRIPKSITTKWSCGTGRTGCGLTRRWLSFT
jgi:hypothetical protein